MKERPIMFKDEMVRAILAGTKTQTRRIAFNADPGDHLWVRETFCNAHIGGYDAREDGVEFLYRATEAGECEGPWKPSIFMPRVACRILLEVTDVRKQRLQEISDEDARDEGVTLRGDPQWMTMYDGIYRDAFNVLWDSINAKRGFGWDVNPWVLAISFRRIKP